MPSVLDGIISNKPLPNRRPRTLNYDNNYREAKMTTSREPSRGLTRYLKHRQVLLLSVISDF